MNKFACAFTGHRPYKFPWKTNESDPRCVALKAVLKKEISVLADAGVTCFYSGCADGTDAWASLILLSLREKIPRCGSTVFCPTRDKRTSGMILHGIAITSYWSKRILWSM